MLSNLLDKLFPPHPWGTAIFKVAGQDIVCDAFIIDGCLHVMNESGARIPAGTICYITQGED